MNRLRVHFLQISVFVLTCLPLGWAGEEIRPSSSPAVSIELTVADSRPVDWSQLLDQGAGQSVLFGVRIAGPSPYERNATAGFAPASNSKLFTSAAALTLLGAEYRIETKLQWQWVESHAGIATELVLIGSGDPTWGMSEFGDSLTTKVSQFADALYQSGVREVWGEIAARSEDSRWDTLAYPVGWQAEDQTRCYGALAQSFNLDINCAEFKISGLKSGAWTDSLIPIAVQVNLKPGSVTSLTVTPLHVPGVVTASYRISGTYQAKDRAVSVYLPVHATKERVRRHLTQALQRRGIVLRSRRFVEVQGEVQSVSLFSPTLAEMLVPFNKMSFNWMGEALFKIMGSRFGDPNVDLLSAAQGVMREFVATVGTLKASAAGVRARPGFFSEEIQLLDGSGVSRASRVTTDALMALLEDLAVRADFPTLWDSLPIAGVDGTLRNRMIGTPAQGVLRAKTGSLKGVYNLAGYVPEMDPNGHIRQVVPFVILSQTTQGLSSEARAAQDRVGAALAGAINGHSSQR